MFEAEIGQNINEEINQITAGGNYGWNIWEGSLSTTGGKSASRSAQRPEDDLPIVDFDHTDPLFPSSRLAATGIYVYRESDQGADRHADLRRQPSGEIFYVNADKLPKGGQNFHRILLTDKGETKTLLQIIKEKNTQQGKSPATRADCAWVWVPTDSCFVLNKHDGTIRLLVP